MSTPTAEPPPVEEIPDVENSFREFQNQMKAAAAAVQPEPEPAPEPEPEPEPAPEPEKIRKAVAKPLENVEPVKGDDPAFKLPIDDPDEEDEQPTADEEELPAHIKEGTAQAAAFRTMRKEKAEISRQLAAEREELQKYRSQVTELEGERIRREELETKLKEYETRLQVTRLEESDVFKSQVEKPLKDIASRANKIADRYGIETEALYTALETPDEDARRNLLKKLESGLDMDVDDKVEIRQLAKELLPLLTKRDELYTNADAALAELQALDERRAAEQAAARADERREATRQVADHLTRKIPILKSLEGFRFDDIVGSVAETDPDALDTHNKVYNALAGQALPKLVSRYAKAMSQIQDLSDELASYQAATPRPGAGGDPRPPADSDDDELPIAEKFRRDFGKR
jgi:hypothetical protein